MQIPAVQFPFDGIYFSHFAAATKSEKNVTQKHIFLESVQKTRSRRGLVCVE